MAQSIDWTIIVRDLLEHHTQVELSKITGVHQSVISDLYRGMPKPQLTYTYGKALLDAHNQLSKQKPEDA